MDLKKSRKQIGSNILHRRIDLGLKQKQVAQVIGVSKFTMSRIERGLSSVPLETAPSLVKFLELGSDVDILLAPPSEAWGNCQKDYT